MAYAFERGEPIARGFQRVMEAQLHHAEKCLKNEPDDRVRQYHEVRKSLKKVRALLRLVRAGLGEERYREENSICRNIGRKLASVRDADVMPETFASVLEKSTERSRSEWEAHWRPLIDRRQQEILRHATVDPETLWRSGEELAALHKRLAQHPLRKQGWDALDEGLTRVYRRGREGFKKAFSLPSDEAFHEWRKQVKYLRHELNLLRHCWPKGLPEFVEALHALSDILGEDHDLAVLRQFIVERRENSAGRSGSTERLLETMNARQGELRARAHQLGGRLYAEKPRAFARRLREYWRVWSHPIRIVPPAERPVLVRPRPSDRLLEIKTVARRLTPPRPSSRPRSRTLS